MMDLIWLFFSGSRKDDGGNYSGLLDPPGNGYSSPLEGGPTLLGSSIRNIEPSVNSKISVNCGFLSAISVNDSVISSSINLYPLVSESGIVRNVSLISTLSSEHVFLSSKIRNTDAGI